MSMIPLSISPQGGPASSAVNDAGSYTNQAPIVVVGNPSLDVLTALNSLVNTTGDQNYRVASRFIPVAQAAVNIPQVGNTGAIEYGSQTPLYVALSVGAIAALLICFLFSKHS